jgi:DNA-binding transcriptional ArsR family regulator
MNMATRKTPTTVKTPRKIKALNEIPNAVLGEEVTQAAKKSFYLSHFTPSMMPAATLEDLLVKRAGLVKRIVQSAVNSVKTGGLHHHLFVGPRGIGKTHLISLLFHRLSKDKTIKSKAKLVWMREEEWGVTSFFELVLRILRNMDANDPSLGIKAQTDALYELPTKQLESVASQILLDVLQGKTLIILLENLDDLFAQMGDAGQKKWRAFIQNHKQFVMLATTPALFAGVTSQKAAFYGSFDTEALDEFSFDEVVELLEKIALLRGDQELADFINTPDGKARIRAVHHLAEGNPRIYIIFAQFLSKAALDELVQAFMHTLDELTPYYQARMKEQSGQQRKILEFLVQYRGAAPVKEIAKACFLSQQACSSQLLILRDRRFVRVEERGRERYYELKEPLMRLCMEVKSSRGEASSLLVEMLRIWYSEQDLEGLEGMEGMEGLVKGQDRMRAMGLPWNKALEEPQKFQAVTTPIYRIFTAMDNALGEKSNTTSILALPIEERKLVMQMRERVERSKHA